MKNLLLFIFLLPVFVGAQNLVPNPSFEDTVYCPNDIDDFAACAEWHSAGEVFWTSPNYFNTCSSSPSVSPPDVAWGSQLPVSGNAYCFLGTHFIFTANARETIQSTLNQSLNIGQKYFVSFYAKLGGRGGVSIASNKLGALFTTYLFTPTSFGTPQNYAQVYTDSVLSDTVSWFHFKESFVADSVYQYITLGNFFDDAHTDTLIMNVGFPNASGYFIDDICVSTDSMLCYHSTDINESTSSTEPNVFPNPASSQINFSAHPLINHIAVYDLLGKLISEVNYPNVSLLTLDCSGWHSGFYIVQLNNSFYKILIK